MAEQQKPVQIFISYARDDDVARVASVTGFVTYLHKQLVYEFRDHGPFRPELCQDTEQVGDGDQFEQLLKQKVEASSIFLIILSHNWLSRPFCRRELEWFSKRWSHEGAESVKRRIVVVGKRHVERDRRPSLLQGQVGFAFYSPSDHSLHGIRQEFYGPRGPEDERYWTQVRKLADHLLRTAGFLVRDDRPPPVFPPNGRTIYLGKPASDMRKPYDRLVTELTQKGYSIVPDPSQELLADSSTREAIDHALAVAEVSVHLLGEKHGPAPEDELPLVDLQLARAAAKAPPFVDEDDKRIGFHRIIWAPRSLDPDPDADARPRTGERDPLAVLTRFGSGDGGDCVVGDTISEFVDFLQQHLFSIGRPRQWPARRKLRQTEANESRDRAKIGAGASESQAKIYVDYQEADIACANKFVEALHQRYAQLKLMMPAFDDSLAEQRQLRRRYLRDCDSVVVCWGAASEVWARTKMVELEDWHKLGRSDRFTRRGFVAGPPPGESKDRFINLSLPDDIAFIDLTESDEPSPAELDRLIEGS